MQCSVLNNLALPELPDLVWRDSQQLAHNLVCSVAQRRTEIGDAPGRLRKRRYDIGDHHLAQTFLFDADEIPARLEMFILEDVGNAIYFSDGNLFFKATVQHIFAGERAHPFDDDLINHITGGKPFALLAIECGGREFRAFHRLRQAFKHLVGRAGNSDPFVVPGAKMTVRHGDETADAFPFPDLSEQAICGGDLIQMAKHSLVGRDVDHLSAASLLAVA